MYTIQFIFSSVYRPNTYFKLHKHAYHEIIYILKGQGQTKIKDTPFAYKAGDVLLTRAGTFRDHKTEKRTEYICFGFLDTEQTDLADGIYAAEKDSSILPLILDIKTEFAQKKQGYKSMCGYKIAEILIKLLRLGEKKENENSIWGIVHKIETEHLFNISVAALAESTAYSYDYFRHAFKRQTGLSPKTFVMQKRMERAKALLLYKDYSVTAVSQICGFSTPAQFSLVFKRETGLTPLSYKKKHGA